MDQRVGSKRMLASAIAAGEGDIHAASEDEVEEVNLVVTAVTDGNRVRLDAFDAGRKRRVDAPENFAQSDEPTRFARR